MNDDIKLKPCPFCGGEVSIATCGDKYVSFFSITRGHNEMNSCKCRVFMESNPFDDYIAGDKDEKRKQLIDAWNRRADNG